MSEPFPWLLLTRLPEIYVALQYIKVVVFRTEKYVYFRKLLIEIPQKCFSKKLLILIIINIIIAIVHLLTVDRKRFHIIWMKKVN